LRYRVWYFGRSHQPPFGHAVDRVSTADLHFQLALERQGAADGPLDLFGSAVADHQVVFAAHVRGDHFVNLVAANAQRFADNDVVERNHSRFGGAAADVDDHVA